MQDAYLAVLMLTGGGTEDGEGLARGEGCRVGLSRLVGTLAAGVLDCTGRMSAGHGVWPPATGRFSCCSSGGLGEPPIGVPRGLLTTRTPDCSGEPMPNCKHRKKIEISTDPDFYTFKA